MSDFYAPTEHRTARTEHYCDICGRVIHRGERYRFQASVLDGSWCKWRECPHCVAVTSTAWNLRLLDDDGWTTDGLFDALAYERDLAMMRLAVGIKCKWRFRSGRVMDVPAVIPRRCVECREPVDSPHSYTWCAAHDAARIERVGAQLAALAGSAGVA